MSAFRLSTRGKWAWTADQASGAPDSAADPLHGVSDPDSYWNRTNAAEAMPGVLTPLGWTVWGSAGERSARRAFHLIGALPARATAVPSKAEDRFLNVFFGRAAIRVDFMTRIGDVMPGTSGEAVAMQVLGHVPDDFQSHPTRRRWPLVAVRFPITFARVPRATLRGRADSAAWWRREVNRTPQLSLTEARGQFGSALGRFENALTLHSATVFACVQPVYDQLSRLAATVGADSSALMSGLGSHDETGMVRDLWAMSRGGLELDGFLERHGYHGPFEGEISSRVWREDAQPVSELLEGYRSAPADADPLIREAVLADERQRAEANLLAALPRARRAYARMLLRLAATRLPLRGQNKTSFLQALDVMRASARHLGAHLADDHALEDPDDVFYLTAAEVVGEHRHPSPDAIAERRDRRRHYLTLRLPDVFQGLPEPFTKDVNSAVDARPSLLTGVGASPGVVEGTVVVVSDPATVDFSTGDILVAQTTDPSWASCMFLAKALVVDIGGLLSHAAVIARELGVPCVMGTGNGTLALRTGDLCRVDGSSGTVEVLERARG